METKIKEMHNKNPEEDFNVSSSVSAYIDDLGFSYNFCDEENDEVKKDDK